jgi:hypothetical protein
MVALSGIDSMRLPSENALGDKGARNGFEKKCGLRNVKPKRRAACYSASPNTEWRRHIMAYYDTSLSYNEYLLTAAMDFWIAMTFPAIYMAKNL